MRHVYFLQSLFYLLLFSSAANASSPNLMTFQTKILSPAGTALEAASVNFRFTILDTAGTCTLYVEDYANIDMTGTQGIVSFPLGSGTKTYPPTATNLYEVFDNSVASFPCQAAGTVSPSATDNRQVVMQFNDGSGWQTLPQMAINGVPYANYATRSENLGAYPAANYLRTATLPTCTAGQSLRWDGSTFTCITASGGGSTYTGVTSIANASGDITLAPATTTGKVTITSGAPSTSTSTGALVITGGVGVSGAVNVQTNITAGTSIYTPQLYGSSSPSGNILIDGTSHATKGNVGLATTGGKVGIGLVPSNGILDIFGTGSGAFQGLNSNFILTDSSSNHPVHWLQTTSINLTGSNANSVSGLQNSLYVQAIQDVTGDQYGMQNEISTLPSSGRTISRVYGISSLVTSSGNGFSTELVGIKTSIARSVGTVTTGRGLLIDSNTGAMTNSYGIYLKGQTNGTNNFAIYSEGTTTPSFIAGKVGIGTTTPSYALDVSGDVNVSGNFRVNGTILSGGSGSSTPTLTGITSISNTSGDITLAPVTATGAVLISSGAASLGTNTGALVVTGGIGLSGAINADGNIWSNGIVSAATSMYSPQLYGSSSASGNILIDGTSHATKGNVILATAGGNVGIGIPSPSAKLQVQGGTVYAVNNANNSFALGSGGTNYGLISNLNSTTWALGYGSSLSTLGNSALSWNDSGNVGIGTTTPASNLHVVRSGAATAIFDSAGSGTYTSVYISKGGAPYGTLVSYGSDPNFYITATQGTGKLQFGSGGTDGRMTLDTNGNVGIGTTSPAHKLSVEVGATTGDGVYVTGTDSPAMSVDNGGASLSFGVATSGGAFSNIAGGNDSVVRANTNGNLILTNTAGGSIKFGTGANSSSDTVKMTILTGGNVGIGTASPQTTLQVAGVISPAANNTYTLGNATYRFTEVYATNGVINTSDRREKKDIYNTDLGLDFINKLRPVSYRWNTGVDNDVHYGLIAQEAEQAIAEVGKTEKTSIVTHDEATDRYGVRYSELISPLIKAAQEIYNRLMGVESDVAVLKAKDVAKDLEIASVKVQAEVEKVAKEKEIEKLKQENAAMKARLDKVEKALKSK